MTASGSNQSGQLHIGLKIEIHFIIKQYFNFISQGHRLNNIEEENYLYI